MILAGRGFGKSWVGSNWINECAETGQDEHMALVGRDAHDVRAFMIEGPSGIIPLAPKHFQPNYEPSKKLITWPNGSKAHIYYAEEPKTIRGPNHSKAWCDEIASWQDAALGDSEDTAWANLMLTMRVGNPKVLVTGTPKPLKLLKQLVRTPGAIIRRGNTYDNAANLSKVFFDKVVAKYVGTRLGRQEISGEILDDNPGAQWKREWIDGTRVMALPEDLDRIVVAIDPSVAGVVDEESEEDSVGLPKSGAEAGIVIAAKRGRQYYILQDASLRGSPLEWARKALECYHFWRADRLVAERNNGGAMVEITLRSVMGPSEECNIGTVWASRGKVTRAEPVAALYEQGRVHHVGIFEVLEDQMCQWEPKPNTASPDRLDAMVWALTELAELDDEVTSSDEEWSKFWPQETR